MTAEMIQFLAALNVFLMHHLKLLFIVIFYIKKKMVKMAETINKKKSSKSINARK